MKRILVLMLAGLMFAIVAHGAVCKKTGIQVDETTLADTLYFATNESEQFAATSIWISLDKSASGNVTIQRGQRDSGGATITFIDDAFTLPPGGTFKSGDENIWCFKFTKSSSTDKLSWSGSQCGDSEIEVPGLFQIVESEAITITDGYHTAAASHYTFLPLQPLGDNNVVAFQISCTTWPDTLWYQVVASDNPMDSLTVFNFGTVTYPQYVMCVTKASLSTDIATYCQYLDNFASDTWSPTGAYAVTLPFSFMVQDANGYLGLPRFVGIRVGADAANAIAGLKIVMYLGTLNTCGGE